MKDAYESSETRLEIVRKKKLISRFPFSRHYLAIYLSLSAASLSCEQAQPTCAERWKTARFNNAACPFRENNCLPARAASFFSTIICLFLSMLHPFQFRLRTSVAHDTARSAFIRDFAFARITRLVSRLEIIHEKKNGAPFTRYWPHLIRFHAWYVICEPCRRS